MQISLDELQTELYDSQKQHQLIVEKHEIDLNENVVKTQQYLDQIQTINNELDQLKEENIDYKTKQIPIYEEQLQMKQNTIIDLEKNIGDINEQLQIKQNTISDFEKNIGDINEQLEIKQNIIIDLEKNIGDMNEQLNNKQTLIDLESTRMKTK
ncbi:unnamed protein product, partial [Didymodactylos carnosus]